MLYFSSVLPVGAGHVCCIFGSRMEVAILLALPANTHAQPGKIQICDNSVTYFDTPRLSWIASRSPSKNQRKEMHTK